MSKPSKYGKKTVELKEAPRPSRIRREPVRADNKLETLAGKVDWGSREWEVRFAVVGILLFALTLGAYTDFVLAHLTGQVYAQARRRLGMDPSAPPVASTRAV